ncbi:LysR family transcriptional regulator [Aquabacterium sp. J223]|uniref:LysR family transcriptional regulator n=1 Tax=Aquabacterium sp. J223 TaxID=2898431 RepID=UPI0021AE06DC|nr:LysR family transcriptional regulator [Aquabacterium sp. J223]UUX95479.1 LysR family transcriptional regulator [Aquabacterium sp. J223]
MQNIDLHTLKVFDEIVRTGSLSRTAERLGLSQPAISISLAKLRRSFDDALFVRVGHAMKPTPQAEAMVDSVRAAIRAIEHTLTSRLDFEPATTRRTFRLAMTDVGQIVLLPRLLGALGRQAPSADLEIVNLTLQTPDLLEAGEVDLAIGFLPELPAGFFQQALFDERFACLVRTGHPRVRGAPTLDQLRAEAHVAVVTAGSAHTSMDRALDSLGVERRVAVRIPNFLGLPTVIGGSDHVCLLPGRAAAIMAEQPAVTAWPLPFELPGYVVKQHWHRRQMADPAHRWLRQLVGELFLAEVRAPAEALGRGAVSDAPPRAASR